jgi:small basic protein (TIGR04137 family)
MESAVEQLPASPYNGSIRDIHIGLPVEKRIGLFQEKRSMTIDKSLKINRGLIRARSVLTRAERLEQLRDADRWKEGDSPVGLPKVRVQKVSLKKKKKVKKEEETEET